MSQIFLHSPDSSSPYPVGRYRGSRLELGSVAHAAIFVIAASWGFGGNIHWMRMPLAWWGTLGAILTLAGLAARWRRQPAEVWPVIWLLPLLAFDALVLLSALNPNYESVPLFDAVVLRPIPPPHGWLPSSARPDLALRELWLYNGLLLAGFNLALNVRRRRSLRRLLVVLAANAVVLAVFGTVQKLTSAPGLFFGAQESPNPAFFASFIYHNHWGAFILLMIAATLALVDHFSARLGPRGWWHSPVPALLGALLIMAAAVPLSTSRSSTVLLSVLVLIAGPALVLRAVRLRRARGERARVAIFGAAAVVGLAIVAILWLGAPIITARVAKTQEQLQHVAEAGGLGGREVVYRNTWRMALDRPWTGWGFESYRTVFVRYNTEGSPRDHLVFHYDQAHSDWLQSLAETGLIGTGLLVLAGALPFWSVRRSVLRAGPGRILLLGCALIAMYAWVEFPFANPAVALSFWILFFSGVRYTLLSETG